MDRDGEFSVTEMDTWGPCPRCGEMVRGATISIPGAYVAHCCHVCGNEWIEDAIGGIG